MTPMTTRQWARVEHLFTGAVKLDRSQRSAYLKKSCRSTGIRREVESLLDQHDKDENRLGVYSSVGGKVLSHYEVGERVGEGGMAAVYKARDTRLKRWVALKVLQPWAMGHTSFREQLIQEAQLISALNHPNIVTVHEVAEEKGVYFIVMEYVTGKTLTSLIPKKGFPAPKALFYALQIADALSVAQAGGVLHGDLKPLNIMVTGTGQVKLLDFGLAKALAAESRTSKETRPWARFGTKPYMAPERLRNLRRDPDPRSEIFSFGLVLHEMLSGRHPFRAAARDAIPNAIKSKSPRTLPSKVPAALARVVRRCLEKNPRHRFRSMRELLQAMLKCDGGKKSAGTAISQRSRPYPPAATVRSHSIELRRVRTALGRIGYQNIPRSRAALEELGRLLGDGPSTAARNAVTPVLKGLILTLGERGGNGVSVPVREMRRSMLEHLKVSTQGDLGRCFKDQVLEHLDLYGMNFAGANLSHVSFRGCFLVEANFRQCNLGQSSFAGAYVRNVDFSQADLSGADFTSADWFNALGLTSSQLQSVRQETLLDCPSNVRAIRRYLEARYGFPFASWGVQVQEQLQTAWSEYLRPGGLRETVLDEWRAATR